MYALPPAVPLTRMNQQQQAVQRAVQQAVQQAPQIVQTVTVASAAPARTDLLADQEQWTWSELRDFVVAAITERFGVFPRDAKKEYGIFSRFLKEYGSTGIEVARYAFGPVCDGWWGGAPISVNRFCRASDAYFAAPIIERLHDVRS